MMNLILEKIMKKNKKVKTNIIRIDTRFEEQVANNLKKFAKLNNQTVNKFISNLVENFLNSQDKSYIKKNKFKREFRK